MFDSWKLVAAIALCGLACRWSAAEEPKTPTQRGEFQLSRPLTLGRAVEIQLEPSFERRAERPALDLIVEPGSPKNGGRLVVVQHVAGSSSADLPPDAQKLADDLARQTQDIQRRAEAELNARRLETVRQLKAIQDNYTRAAKLDEAVAVRDLIRRLEEQALHALADPGSLVEYRNRVGQSFHFQVTANASGSVYGTDVYSDDSSLATAAVHAGVLRAGQTGVVKVTILGPQNSFAAATRQDVTSYAYGSYGGSYRVESPFARVMAMSFRRLPDIAVLPDPGDLMACRGQVGQVLKFDVVGSTSGYVWGTDVYTDDSSLAAAAVHAGVLKVGERGVVTVVCAAGQADYTGSTRGGVTSSDYSAWGGSYRFVSASPATDNIIDATRSSFYLSTYRGQTGQSMLFRVTGRTTGMVWGGDVYTDDSDLATAAVHAGILANGQTGVVKVTILSGQASYAAVTRGGVSSQVWSSWLGSYRVEGVAAGK